MEENKVEVGWKHTNGSLQELYKIEVIAGRNNNYLLLRLTNKI